MRIPAPRLYLGTMTFGWTGQTSSVVDKAVSQEMVQIFIDYCNKSSLPLHIDTARVYASGDTEAIVGSALNQISSDDLSATILGTKAHPSCKKGLSTQGIREQFQMSLDKTKVNSFGEYYLHQPDTETPLLESLQCVHSLMSDGLVKSFGMSNYHVSEMKRTFEICQELGLTKPTVYQGLYNPLNRAVERELIPLLKANGCSFIAYNPLAGGLLSGKHKKPGSGVVMQGRFKDNANYLPRFYTDENFDAIELIKEACEKEEITLVEATFKWLLKHSALTENDGVLLGASSAQQLQQNLDACRPVTNDCGLSEEILSAFDSASKITEKKSFPYWRSYSADMPGRESMDQGASYSAVK